MIKTIKTYVYLTMPDRRILVFENTSEVIQAENVLKAEGWKIRVLHSGILLETLGWEMEAMGGTGDTLTGIVTALVGTGMEIMKAATVAAIVNRLAGHYVRPTSATQMMEIIQHIPTALARVLSENEKGERQ